MSDLESLKSDFPGWSKLLQELEDLLPKGVEVYAKEKYGSLRVYVDEPYLGQLEAILCTFEMRSVETCQVCGEPGNRVVKEGWVYTRCEEHSK